MSDFLKFLCKNLTLTYNIQISMKKITLKIGNKTNYSHLFLKDPQSDLIVIVNDKVYPVHRKIMKESQYLDSLNNPNEKVHIISNKLSNELFQIAIGFLYGIQFNLDRNSQIFKLLQTAKYLRIKSLENQILSDMSQYFQDYGIFSVMNLSYRHNYLELYNNILKQLEQLEFQQIFINKFDLLNCETQFFISVLHQFYYYEVQQASRKINTQRILKIVKQYEKINKNSIKIQAIFAQDTDVNKKIRQIKKKGFCRKRSSSWQAHQTFSFGGQNMELETKSQLYKNLSHKQQRILKQSVENGQQVSNLKNLNKNMIKQNNLLKQQLQKLKIKLMNELKNSTTNKDLQQLEDKCRQYKETEQLDNVKFQKIKSQIQKLSQSLSQNSKNTSEDRTNDFLEVQVIQNRKKRKSECSEKNK